MQLVNQQDDNNLKSVKQLLAKEIVRFRNADVWFTITEYFT